MPLYQVRIKTTKDVVKAAVIQAESDEDAAKQCESCRAHPSWTDLDSIELRPYRPGRFDPMLGCWTNSVGHSIPVAKATNQTTAPDKGIPR